MTTEGGAAEEVDAIVQAVVEADRVGNHARAYELANAALERGFRHPVFHSARAAWHGLNGRFEEALSDLEALRSLTADDPALLDRIGHCLLRLGRPREALDALDQAVAAAPDLAQAHYQRGVALGMLNETEAMKRAYEATIACQPDHVDALASLALEAARSGDLATARDYATRALAHGPRHAVALVVLATTEIGDGDHGPAKERLDRALNDPRFVTDKRLELALDCAAQALDRGGQFADAFATRHALNMRRRGLLARAFGSVRAVDQVRHRIETLRNLESWPITEPAASLAAGHVFLLGFMRSGTTLLETVLAASPEVVAFDEREFLADAVRTFLLAQGGLERLAALEEADLAPWREKYWDAVSAAGAEVANKTFVDKMPFNSLRLPLIARLFPDAKILFAIRDPRDVVFSCFRHSFEASLQTFEFLDLEDCANFYAATMELVLLCRQKLPLVLHEHRYEDLVDDFDRSVRAVCDFTAIPWTDSMPEFNRSASVAHTRSVSAAQVRRELYSGVGHWRRYRAELAPIFPILAPWVERFGYPSE